MIDLDVAIKGMGTAQDALRGSIANPTVLSEQMMRLSQYVGIVDEHLAGIEKEYEVTLMAKIKKNIDDFDMKVTPAETMAKMEMAEIKGQILYLTRLSSSSWRQVGVVQSRVKHLTEESKTNI